MTRRALGRGLDALIPQEMQLAEDGVRDEIHVIPIDKVVPNPRQPRSSFEPERLEELARSIREKGILEPLLLRLRDDGTYEIIAGERRLRAARLAGLSEVPAILRSFQGRDSLEVALVENLQREDLNPVEEARAYHRLAEEYGLTHAQISDQVGKDRSTVTNLLRLLRLPASVLDHVSRGTLSMGHARVLLGLESQEEQERTAETMVAEGWSVRQAEQYITQRVSSAKRGGPGRRNAAAVADDAEVARVVEALRRTLGTRVELHHRNKGGRMEIYYTDREELERLLEVIGVQVF